MTLTMELLICRPNILEKVYISSSIEENVNTERLRSLCKKSNIKIETNDKAFNILTHKGNCYVIGVFHKFKTSLFEGSHIVLVNPADAGNVGNIVRTAVAFGFQNCAIIKPAVDLFDPKTVRASMGAIFHINFELFDSIVEYRARYPNQNLFAFMLTSNNPINEQRFDEPYSLIFGNEATGLPHEYEDFCKTVIIPQSNRVDSLNLTIAASIAMYVAKNQC